MRAGLRTPQYPYLPSHCQVQQTDGGIRRNALRFFAVATATIYTVIPAVLRRSLGLPCPVMRLEEEAQPDRDRTPEEGPVLPHPLPLTVILDNLRSAFNVGSIFRTAEAARLERLILCGITPYPPNEKLDRTALGTVDRVAWSHRVSTQHAVEEMEQAGVPVFACEVAEGAASIRTAAFPRPLALVLGHEVAGVSPVILRRADTVVRIPLYGRKNSLNVAKTFGIAVFEVLRQWGY